ncbi:MAG: MarR family transcriptional regulator [Rhizobiales bacterium]|nr:MarR family transcriptional regulator [Hyphomicrobiales bacterium]
MTARKRGRTSASKAADTVPIEQLLDYKIGQLRKLLDRYSSPAISEQFGLSLAEWRMLSHIHAGGSVTAFWLCRRLQADRAEVSRACASLISRGYVVSKPNPADARSALLELTRAGQAMYGRIMPVRLRLQKELTGALDRRENALLYRALDKLTKAISDRMAPAAETAKAKRSAAKKGAIVRTHAPRYSR